MGLDITAYKKLTKLDCVFDADGEPIDPITRESIDNCFKVYENADFPGRANGLEHKGVYAYAGYMDFRAGGYGGYNAWREQLAKLAGYEAKPYERYGQTEMLHAAACWDGRSGPFSELIYFTDCDGVIGPVVAAKLSQDFKTFHAKAEEVGGSFFAKYQEFAAAFDMAEDGGAVHFH
jgi:hypothetical protein